MNLVLRPGSSPQTGAQLFPSIYNAAAPPGSTVHQLANDIYNPRRVSEVWLPDGIRSYKFRYNSYGELARVELPTGGAIEYDWINAIALGSGALPGIEYDPGTSVYRRVIERRVYANGNTLDGKTVLGPPEWISDRSGYVLEDQVDAYGTLLGRTKHYYTGIQQPNTPPVTSNAYPFYQSWRDGKEYQTELFHNNGTTVLRRITHTWNQSPPGWYVGNLDHAPTNNPRITETLTTLVDTNQVSKQTFTYDQFSNLTDTYEFDFGSGVPPPTPVRRSHTDYLTTNPVNSLDYTSTNIHIRNLPSQQSVFDSGNTERARITYEYDNYSTQPNHANLLPRANISGYELTFNSTTRGNVTAITQYLLSNGTVTGSISAYTQYDIAGNVVKTIDARQYETYINYDDRFGGPNGNAQLNSVPFELSSVSKTSFAFVTQVTNALSQTSFTQFDYYTGRAVDSEDVNGVVSSSYSENDLLDRPTKIIRAAYPETSAKSQTKFAYDDLNRIVTATSDHNSFDDPYPLKSQTFYDGLGRSIETRTFEGGSNYVAAQQQYDALGRPFKTSNPFRNGETAVWTITAFDALGRVISITTPDNAAVTTSYSGNAVTAKDQAGKLRRSVTDAAGRLIRVDEPDGGNNLGSVSSPTQPTSYGYDVLDSLLTVTQGTQSRSFAYDSLKRLTSATNPESGTTNYQYDNNGNLLIKTDARGLSTHFSYDALNRPIRRWYNGSNDLNATTNNSPVLPSGVGATEEVKYFYDSQTLPAGAPSYSRGSATGRLVATTYGSGSSTGDYFAFDVMGRPTLKIQQLGGINYQVQRTYNRDNSVVGQTYPSGHAVSYDYDAAGRVSSFGGTLGSGPQRTYTHAILYSPFGGIKKEQLGTDTAIYNRSIYNSRGQLSEIRLSSSATHPSATDWNRGAILNQYSDQCNGPTCNGTDNNGTLKRQEVFIPHNDQISGFTNWVQTYDYDTLNRLQRVKEINSNNTTMWQQEYLYDRWGNRRIHQTNTWGLGINNADFTVNSTNNRLGVPGGQSGTMTYDSVGNLTADTYSGAGGRTYDADNRMIAAQGFSNWQYYTYNAAGKRVIRNVDGGKTWQVYGFDGELLAEYAESAAATSPQKEYGYRNGQLLVTADLPAGQPPTGEPPIQADDFNDNWRDPAKWNLYAVGPNPSPTYEQNGRLEIQSQYSATDSNYGGYVTAATHNLNGKQTSVEVVAPTTNNGGGGNYAGLSWGDSPYRIMLAYNYIYYDNSGFYFDPVRDRYIRLRDDTTTQTVYYESSTNGVTWETRASRSRGGASLDYTVRLYNGNTAGWTSVDLVIFDNFRLEVSEPQPILADDFNDNWRDPAKWNLYTVGPNPSPTYEQNGRLEIQSQYSATDSNYGGYVTAATHNLNGKQTSVEVVAPTTNNGGGGNYAGLSWGDSPYRIMLAYNYIYYDNTGFYFDPERDRYIRLRDDPNTQTVYYESSANGVSWDVRASRSRGAASLDYTVRLYNGNTAGWTSVDLVIFDNFRLEVSGSQGPANTNITWLVADHLGTPRMQLGQTGSLTGVKRHDYLPFGEEVGKLVGQRTSGLGYSKTFTRQKFTSKERDRETGLDYFEARYYSSTQGRFTSSDPLLSSGRPAVPQSWNRYAYVLNSPLVLVDPDGLDWGVTEYEENGRKVIRYHWFNGKIGTHNGHKYTPVKFGKDGTLDVPTDDGSVVRISNIGIVRQEIPGAPRIRITGQERLNAAAGMFDGALPFGRQVREFLLGGRGGVDTDSAEYQNSSTISTGVTVGGSLFSGVGEVRIAGCLVRVAAPNRIYSARVLLRSANESGPMHNFPESFNAQIFQGSRTVTRDFFNVDRQGLSNDAIMYKAPGIINGKTGTFEIGVRPSVSGRTEVITHRFFQPDK